MTLDTMAESWAPKSSGFDDFFVEWRAESGGWRLKRRVCRMRLVRSADYRIPESFNAFCKIVSFTAAKTSLIFDVSVACVKLVLLLAPG